MQRVTSFVWPQGKLDELRSSGRVCACVNVCMIRVYTVCAADKNVVVCKQNVCFGDNNPSGQQGV